MPQSAPNQTHLKMFIYICLYLDSKEFRRKWSENLQDHVENWSFLAFFAVISHVLLAKFDQK